jgi:hypothetical protein
MVVFDLLRMFKQVYDDSDITPYQMAYWVLVHADKLRKQHIEKRDTGEYVSIHDVSVLTDTDDRKYITLPYRIYDMDLDKAIDFIAYEKQSTKEWPSYVYQTFSRTSMSKAKRLNYRDEEVPSSSNPYFYRSGDTVYLLGVENITLPTVEVGLMTTLNPADTSLDLDQSFDLPQDLIPVLQRQIMELGLFVLSTPRDLNNDGTGDAEGKVQPKKLTSVNEFRQDG